MKFPRLILFFFIIVSNLVSGQPNEQNELIVTITNIKNIEGKIQIGLFNEQSDFTSTEGQYRVVYEEVTSSEVISVIKNLPEGDYAIAIFHDENRDNICNKNFIGIPKEPYGFSTNFKPKFRAPKFKNVKFSFPAESNITINLRH